jgi:omega-6 fatty acid desaturase (delta-12 desaturase)
MVAAREALRDYACPNPRRTALDLATSVVPYLGLLGVMAWLIHISVLLALALAPLAAGFMLRTFIVFHDCTHGSMFRRKRANRYVGVFLGLLLYMPFESWRHSHAVHHATAGDLDRRGQGDVATLTVEEYKARSARARLAYRLFRHPLVMFGLGPLLAFAIGPRLVSSGARPRDRRAILATNVAVAAVVATACLTLGWWQYLVVQWPAAWLAGSAGIFLFYVQHQFEDVYWERNDTWDYADAAMRGSSFLKLPAVLRFFSGNIGYHHVHHFSARIPNYHLRRAHEELELFRDVPVMTLRDALQAPRLKLWDERRGRLVSFRAARA